MKMDYNNNAEFDIAELHWQQSVKPMELIVAQGEQNDERSSSQCMICLEEVDDSERLLYKGCLCSDNAKLCSERNFNKFSFCKCCLLRWLQTNATCPICKMRIYQVWHRSCYDIKSHLSRSMLHRLKETGQWEGKDDLVEQRCQLIDLRFQMELDKKPLNGQVATEFISGIGTAMDRLVDLPGFWRICLESDIDGGSCMSTIRIIVHCRDGSQMSEMSIFTTSTKGTSIETCTIHDLTSPAPV